MVERASYILMFLVAGIWFCDAGRLSIADDLTAANPESASPRTEGSRTGLNAKLAESADFDYDKIPLETFVEDLERQLGVDVRLDRKALEEAKISVSLPITGKSKGIPVRKALRRMLANHKLDFVVYDHEITVTTVDAKDQMLFVEVYNVAAIAPTPSDVGDLAGLLTRTAFEGDGSIVVFRGLLVVQAKGYVHKRIRRLINAIDRKLKATLPQADPYGPPS